MPIINPLMTSPIAWPRRSGATMEATSGTTIWIAAQDAPRTKVAASRTTGVGERGRAQRGHDRASQRAQDQPLVLDEIDQRYQQQQAERVAEQRQRRDQAGLEGGHAERTTHQPDQDLRREQVGDDGAGRDGADPDQGAHGDGARRGELGDVGDGHGTSRVELRSPL
ncbi:hypothetical protein [Bradyrhizobium sp. ISRA463]|uniref:hypothetical protein n=1 Tax=Bradyrhizobium sp. ISRA463 TaxID=2866199 RepID=UPI00247973F6|nr:hypothetical protein [Bradyrhizobium sp. ISRA463]WGS17885.1 hypothetical protein MTX22_25125 [Bradyrhizobium sp. ISRA463]